MRFRIEVLKRLRNFVFRDRAVVLREMRHQFAGLGLHSEEKINEVDVELESAHRLLFSWRWRSRAYRRRVRRRDKLSPPCRAKQQDEQKNSEIAARTHTVRFDERNDLKESIR